MWFTNLLLKATGYIKKNSDVDVVYKFVTETTGFANVFVPVIISNDLL